MKSFKDQNRDLQYLIRDMLSLRKYNDQQAKNGTPDNAMLFAEATVLCVSFERFLRIVPAMKLKIKNKNTLSDLLNHAFSGKKPVFKPIHTAPMEDFKRVIREVRNGILHGLFDDLAEPYIKAGKISNTEEYFKNGYFTQDMEIIYRAFDGLIKQVDPETGNII